MKISSSSISGFIKSPTTRIIFLYGPDTGQVRDYANILSKQIVDDPKDPFRLAELSKEKLNDDPALLADEAAALSFTGGQRVVRIIGGDDWLAKHLESYLEDAIGEARIIIEGGDLGPTSSLRKLCENSDLVAAIPCYVDEGQNLSVLIDSTLRASGYQLNHEARQYLLDALGGDRLVVKGELEKLMLYMGSAKQISFDDVEAAIGNSAVVKVDEAVYAAGDQHVANLIKALDKCAADEVAPVALLRSALYHFQKLAAVRISMAEGQNLQQILNSMRPPIFFKVRPRFEQHARRWTDKKLETALEKLMAAEALVKQTHIPAEIVAQQTLLDIASIA